MTITIVHILIFMGFALWLDDLFTRIRVSKLEKKITRILDHLYEHHGEIVE